jgi:hypothetical protein
MSTLCNSIDIEMQKGWRWRISVKAYNSSAEIIGSWSFKHESHKVYIHGMILTSVLEGSASDK